MWDFIGQTPRTDPFTQSKRLEGTSYYMTLVADRRYTLIWTWDVTEKAIRVKAVVPIDATSLSYDDLRSPAFTSKGLYL